jgi:DNA-binding SARP family transcriptional activator
MGVDWRCGAAGARGAERPGEAAAMGRMTRAANRVETAMAARAAMAAEVEIPDSHPLRAGSSVMRAWPSRLMETALRMLQAAEWPQRPGALGRDEVHTGDHLLAGKLIRELRALLSLAHHEETRSAEPLQSPGAAFFPPDSTSGETALSVPPFETEAVVATETDLQATPSVEIYLLSSFAVFVNDKSIEDWPNCKGKSIFKYLVTHRGQPVPKEVLMELFWPESVKDAARNNLNVAIYGLRKALARGDAKFPFVLFRQGSYSLNPALRLWIDSEAFVECVHLAQLAEQRADAAAAIAEYRVAQTVYQNALLVEDRYEDWLVPERQRLEEDYLKVLRRLAFHHFTHEEYEACAGATGKMLGVDNCDEQAHRQLMRCYSRMGNVHLALRQYHLCVGALSRELNLIPSPQTVALFHQIRQRQPI